MIDKTYVSWKDVYKFVDSVADRFEDANITGVYGIPRGGLVFAVMLSHRLAVPMLMAPSDGCLIVDDIADTGITLQHYRQEHYSIATMFYHEQSKIVPDFWMFEKKDKWIVFPWEGDWEGADRV